MQRRRLAARRSRRWAGPTRTSSSTAAAPGEAAAVRRHRGAWARRQLDADLADIHSTCGGTSTRRSTGRAPRRGRGMSRRPVRGGQVQVAAKKFSLMVAPAAVRAAHARRRRRVRRANATFGANDIFTAAAPGASAALRSRRTGRSATQAAPRRAANTGGRRPRLLLLLGIVLAVRRPRQIPPPRTTRPLRSRAGLAPGDATTFVLALALEEIGAMSQISAPRIIAARVRRRGARNEGRPRPRAGGSDCSRGHAILQPQLADYFASVGLRSPGHIRPRSTSSPRRAVPVLETRPRVA